MRWLVLVSRKGRRERHRLTPTGEHRIKWGWGKGEEVGEEKHEGEEVGRRRGRKVVSNWQECRRCRELVISSWMFHYFQTTLPLPPNIHLTLGPSICQYDYFTWHQWYLICSYLAIIYTRLIRLECADSKVWSSITSPLASHCLQHICQEDIRYTWRPVIFIFLKQIDLNDYFFWSKRRCLFPGADDLASSMWRLLARTTGEIFSPLKLYFWNQELRLWLSDIRRWYL